MDRRFISLGSFMLLAVTACSPVTKETIQAESPSSTATSTRTPISVPTDALTHLSPDRPTVTLPRVDVPGMATAPAGGYEAQKLEWKPCEAVECAQVLAPMDRSDPASPAITLHLTRKKAAEERQGSLFVNPGGPGADAGWLAASGRFKGAKNLDTIGMDPRGTGKSTPILCADNPTAPQPWIDALQEVDSSPDSDAEYDALRQAQATLVASCQQHMGDYLAHIGTPDVIADMDLVRTLLGDPVFNYVGYSYGTWLGAVYATTYPDKVGRMVLDSPVNPHGKDVVTQAEGFERAFGLFAEWAGKHRSDLGTDAASITSKVVAFIDGLDAQPITVGNRHLTQSIAVNGIAAMLYGGEAEWQMLDGAITSAISGDGDALMVMSDQMSDRADSGSYGPMFFAFPAILCLDEGDDGFAAAKSEWSENIKKAPNFGRWFGPSVACQGWPVKPIQRTRINAASVATPIVVVASTGDPATPYEYGAAMTQALGKASLLTLDGPGHGAYGDGNACIDKEVDTFLAEGVVPQNGFVCHS
ncbi:MAG: alpha/beta hydrolase [Propionibacteriaceae bacterium]